MIGRWKESAQNLLVHFWAGLGGMEVSLDVWESKLRQGSPDERPKAKVDELMSLIRSHGKYSLPLNSPDESFPTATKCDFE